MKLVRLAAPASLENLKLLEEDPPEPRPGEIQVRVHACSINFRDDSMIHGRPLVADGRVPLSDGAGEITAVGEGVD